MIAETVIPLFSMLCYALLGIMLARQFPLRREARLFLGYLIVIMLWSFGSFMMHANIPSGSTLFWNHFLAVWPSFAAIIYFQFVRVFLRKPSHSLWLFVGFLLCAIWLFALARGYIIQEAYFSENTYQVQFGLGFFILFPMIFCFVSMAVFWLAKEFRSTKDPFIRNRAGYLLIGISIQLLLSATNLIPWLARYPIDQVGNVINAFLIGYAILKYKLLDIDIILRKGSFYAILTSFVVAIYFAVAVLVHTLVQARTGYDIWISVSLTGILVAVSFLPLYRVTQRQLDRFFDRKRYDYREMLRTSSKAMASTIDLDELISYIMDRIPQTMGAEKASMLLLDDEGQQYHLTACKGNCSLSHGAACFRYNSPLSKYLSQKNSCLTADEINRMPRFRALWKSEREVLKRLDAAVLVPLKAQEALVGLLVLSPKKSGEAYTDDDLGLLSTVANQLATALRNAQLYEKSRQAYQELESAQERVIVSERLKALGEMTSGIAHDFNNILTTILARAQLALGKTENDKAKNDLMLIEQAALDAAGMVRRLQDFCRVRTDCVLDVIDVNQVASNALGMIKPRLDEGCETLHSRIEVVADLGKISPIEGSAAELREALLNILINGIEAMPHGGKLTVKSEQEGNFAVISITDTGIGMTSEVRKRVFEPFFTTKGAQGLGMGLSVVYGIISRHKGQVSVSSSPGRGSTFTIRIPVTEDGETEAVPVQSRKSGSINATILVVDDDEGSRDALRDLLIGYGHKVDTASTGKEGIILARQKDYDVVLADLGMPDISGDNLAAEIKARNHKTQVALVTGWGIQLDPMHLKKRGVSHVIAKPFTKDDILAIVDQLLVSSASQMELNNSK